MILLGESEFRIIQKILEINRRILRAHFTSKYFSRMKTISSERDLYIYITMNHMNISLGTLYIQGYKHFLLFTPGNVSRIRSFVYRPSIPLPIRKK